MTQFVIMVAAFFVAIGILVTAHEYGHFWVARRLGFKVLRFAIGFGKPLARRNGKDGVEYVLGTIPLGGYVKLADEREGPVAPEDLARAFNRRPIWQRVAVLLAGAGANLVFALFAYWLLFMHGIPGIRPVIGTVTAGSLAAHAGLTPGDEIERIGTRRVATREATVLELMSRLTDDGRLELFVRHGEQLKSIEIAVPSEQRRALTEPGAWARGLGFQFSEPHLKVIVGRVTPDGSAAAAGLVPGDEILSVAGEPVTEYTAFRARIRAQPGATLELRVRRGANELVLPVVARAKHESDDPHSALIGQIGVEAEGEGVYPREMQTLERYGPIAAIPAAFGATADNTELTLKFLWRMLTGRVSLKNVSGPISIATYAGLSALQGPATFLNFLAVISISLAVLNLMPIPILDGGQIVYQLAEAVRGRPLSERAQVLGQQLGIVLLLLLMSLAFYNDIAWRFG